MEQTNTAGKIEIPVDFQRPGMPLTANLLQPSIYKDGGNYTCAFGSELKDGVYGHGATPEQAAQDWDRNLTERMASAQPDDDLVKEIRRILQQHGAESRHAGPPDVKPNDGPPHTATHDTREGDAAGIPSVPPHRRNTTDQSNNDGSE
ncbi:MAG: hypothetical protein NVV59_20675 [Chitinophagaceae bacterium]|nr:hypothetical protein [Chitinophagaceae bacterium]